MTLVMPDDVDAEFANAVVELFARKTETFATMKDLAKEKSHVHPNLDEECRLGIEHIRRLLIYLRVGV